MKLTLPSGLSITPPATPHTWVEQAGVVYGDPLSAKTLEADVAAAIAFHRQRPMIQAIASAVTAIAAATYVPIPLAQELIDTPSGHNDATNTSRLYAPRTTNSVDWYLVYGVVPFASSTDPTKNYTTGYRTNGSSIVEGSKNSGTTGHVHTGFVCDLVQLAGDGTEYVELIGRQDTAGSVNTVVASRSPALSMRWVGTAVGIVVALPSTPRTWAGTDLLTASTAGAGKAPLNVHIRDVIRWLNFPAVARITSISGSQTIPTGASTWTSIAMPTMTADPYFMWTPGATNAQLMCQRAGLYFVHGLASVGEALSATGYRACRILHTIAAGGTAVYGGASSPVATASTGGTQLPVTTHIRMAVGDTIELQMQQNDAGALTVKNGTGYSRLIAVWRSL